MTTHTFQKISVLFSFYIVLYLYEDLRPGSKPTSCKMDHNLITIDLDKKCVLKKKRNKAKVSQECEPNILYHPTQHCKCHWTHSPAPNCNHIFCFIYYNWLFLIQMIYIWLYMILNSATCTSLRWFTYAW